MTRFIRTTAAAILVLAPSATVGTSSADTARSCHASAATNRRIVLAFYNEGLVGLHPRAAFDRYMIPTFVEHKPAVPRGTREATAAYLEQVIVDLPRARWEIIRTIAEGDLVFLHARFTP